jgi:hypothetical protein
MIGCKFKTLMKMGCRSHLGKQCRSDANVSHDTVIDKRLKPALCTLNSIRRHHVPSAELLVHVHVRILCIAWQPE